ncbi:MAG: phosphatidylserine/phosphatidylglycerophosphate/cardiolipin synthase family protein [Verrucomicrobiales bacterium]|nr:phosphatidylserine/phosphatidylglycerophosphate/cardiolipin synthase family protein [Verrucomicrobiales bacterium]
MVAPVANGLVRSVRGGPRRLILLAVLGVAGDLVQAAQPRLLSARGEAAAQLEAVGDRAPLAFARDNRLRLYFPAAEGQAVFKARWRKPTLLGRTYTSAAAELVVDEHPGDTPVTSSDWRRVTVVDEREWPALARAAADLLVDVEPLAGTVVRLLNFEAVLYHDVRGVLREASLEGRPPGVRITHHVTADEFATAVVRRLEARAAEDPSAGPLFLVMPRLDPTRPDFILVDLPRRLSVYLSAPPLPTDPRGRPGGAISGRMIGSLTLESHGLALVKNPVSAAARLVNLGYHAVARVLTPPLPAFQGALVGLNAGPGMDLEAFERTLDRITHTRRTSGSAQLLLDGGQFFPAFEAALRAARQSIHLRVCIFDRDDVAVDLADLLRARSAEVDVRVLLDRMSSLAVANSPPASQMRAGFKPPPTIGRYLERDSRVRVRPFLNPWLSADHSKVLLVDEAVAFVGGMNLGREYRYEWHDLMVELRGPVVDQLATDFSRAWAHASLGGDLAYVARSWFPGPRRPPAPVPSDAMALRVLKTQTLDHQIRGAVFAALKRARRHVFLENPYLTDRSVVKALVAARRRGVDVRVILPNQNNLLGGTSSNFLIANTLLRRGVRVFIYPGMTHVKALWVDGWVCLGSANFNNLSLRLNQEVNVATSDPGFAEEVRTRLFETGFRRSHELTVPLVVTWTDRLAERILRQL